MLVCTLFLPAYLHEEQASEWENAPILKPKASTALLQTTMPPWMRGLPANPTKMGLGLNIEMEVKSATYQGATIQGTRVQEQSMT